MLNLLLQYLWIYCLPLPPKQLPAKVVGKLGKLRTLKEGVQILLGNNLMKPVHLQTSHLPWASCDVLSHLAFKVLFPV